MALPTTGRGWVPSTDEAQIESTTKLAFDSLTITDGTIEDLSQKYTSLVSLELTGCTFNTAAFSDLPVLENAATLTTITASGSTGLDPGDTDGVPVTWAAATKVAAIDVSDNGWTQTQVNAFLVALKAAVDAGMSSAAAACTLDISSNAVPSGAGATAVTALEGDSPAWTITADS